MEDRPLPADLDYAAIAGLRLEAREKLQRIRPANFGQAGRISGVSPADLTVLMVYMDLQRRGPAGADAPGGAQTREDPAHRAGADAPGGQPGAQETRAREGQT